MHAWSLSKPAVRAAGGVVVSQHRQASQAGAAVLEAGGTAVDAAVVTALVGGVVEPWLSGLGGGGFLVAYDPAVGASRVLDFGMVAPRGLRSDDYPLLRDASGAPHTGLFGWPAVEGDHNLRGGRAIGVPGTVAGLAEALTRLGTISWRDALTPALRTAEAGLPVDGYTTLSVATAAADLAHDPVSQAIWLPGGMPPVSPLGRPPRRIVNPALVTTLERLRDAGPDDFYEGETARALIADLQAAGSRMSEEDLRAYAPQWREARTGRFGAGEVDVVPGLSGGPTLLRILELLEADLTLGREPHLATAAAIRTAYQERLTTMGAGSPHESCTSHVSVVDREGRVCALTSTLLARFGSKVTSPSTGVLMNNMMMWFDPRPGRPNSVRPGVRPLANMSPAIARADDGRRIALGAAGGRRIVPALAQLLRFLLIDGDDLETAARRPRLDASGATIEVDPRLPDDVQASLTRLGEVRAVEDDLFPSPYAVASLAAWEPANDRAADPPGADDGPCVGVAHLGTPWPDAVGARDPSDTGDRRRG